MIASSPSDDCKPLQLGHGRSGGCDERCGICAPWPQPLTPSPRMAVATRSPSRVRRAPLDAAGGSPGRGLPPPSTAAPKAISPCVRSLVIIEVTQQVVDIIVEPSQILGRVIRYNDPGLTCQSAPKRNPGSASNCDPHQRLRSGRPRSPWRGPARVAPCPHERRAWGGAVGPRGRSAGHRPQVRFLKRQLSLPVSRMSQWCVRRSSSGGVIAPQNQPSGASTLQERALSPFTGRRDQSGQNWQTLPFVVG